MSSQNIKPSRRVVRGLSILRPRDDRGQRAPLPIADYHCESIRRRATTRMRRLIESTFVTLGGEIGSPHVWGPQYLNAEQLDYVSKLLFAADALLLGRVTYEGFSRSYPDMDRDSADAPVAFIERMNSIPKFVASRTLKTT